MKTSGQKLTRDDLTISAKERFAAKCRAVGDCILWTGTLNNRGYGQLSLGTDPKKPHMRYAHRIAWVLVHGDLADNVCVLHRCDEPRCVNTEHLFLGSYKDNTDDMVRKGRHPWKTQLPWQKLSATDGERIRDLRSAGCTQQQIADRFEVSRPLISLILNNHVQHSACPST